MQASLVVTLIGTDRPGIVARLAALAADSGAGWQQSKMARLAGKFAGIVRLEVPAESLEALERSLGQLQSEGLRLTIERGAAQVEPRLHLARPRGLRPARHRSRYFLGAGEARRRYPRARNRGRKRIDVG